MSFNSTKIIELGSCAFRQPRAKSHCRFIHGYRLVAKFWFSCNELDENNWVVDFGSLKGLKDKLEQHFDHTTIISKDDPFLDDFNDLNRKGVIDLRIDDGVGIEMFAKKCFDIANIFVKAATNDRCDVEKVEVWEHEKNSATYTNKFVQKTIFADDDVPLDAVDWDAYREAEACGPQPNPKDFMKEDVTDDNFDHDGTLPEEKTPGEIEEEQQRLPGAKRDKNIKVGAPVGNVKSQGLGDPFAGTSWGSDKPSDPLAPKRG